MGKLDELKGKMSGTTKTGKTIGKKSMPVDKKNVTVRKSNTPLSETTQINFKIPKRVHFLAKMVAMEEGKKLGEYLTDIIIDDLAERGKM